MSTEKRDLDDILSLWLFCAQYETKQQMEH